jgi:hypothetical protein
MKRAPQERADGLRAVPDLELVRAHLEEQRRHEEEVVPADEHDLDVAPVPEQSLEVPGGVRAAEPATKHHDSRGRRGGGGRARVL